VLGNTLTTWTYAEVLVRESGAAGATAQLVQAAYANYAEAVRAQQEDMHAGALFEALEAQARINVALTLLGHEATGLEATRIVERAREGSQREIARARALGVEPVLAVSMHDFAGTVVGDGNLVEGLVLYHTARMVAKSAEFTLRPVGRSTFVGFPRLAPRWETETVLASGLAGALFGAGLVAAFALARSKKTTPPRAQVPTQAARPSPYLPARNARAALAPMPVRRRTVRRLRPHA